MIHVSDFLFVLFYIVFREKRTIYRFIGEKDIVCTYTHILVFFIFLYMPWIVYKHWVFVKKKNPNTCSLRWNLYLNFQTFSCHWLIFTTCRKVDLNKIKMNISLRHNYQLFGLNNNQLKSFNLFWKTLKYDYGTIKDIENA